jgi:hypothetical protein
MKSITIDTVRFNKLVSIESFKTKKGRFNCGEQIQIANLNTKEAKFYEIIAIIPVDNFIDRIRVKQIKFD